MAPRSKPPAVETAAAADPRAAAADETPAAADTPYVSALRFELEGYLRRGLADRADQVRAELARHGAKA